MRYLLLLSSFLLLSACATNLELKSISKDWEIQGFNKNGFVILKNTANDFKNGIAAFDFRGIIYNSFLSKTDCHDKRKYHPMMIYTFAMRFYKEKIDRNNDYKLMLDNIYFIKDKKKYPVKFYDPMISLKNSHYIDLKQTLNAEYVRPVYLSSPLICGELDGATLIFDGLHVNQQKHPIKLNFSFKEPQKIPLYE